MNKELKHEEYDDVWHHVIEQFHDRSPITWKINLEITEHKCRHSPGETQEYNPREKKKKKKTRTTRWW